jgi:hypothetical protein
MVLNNNLITNRKIVPQTVVNFYAERYCSPTPTVVQAPSGGGVSAGRRYGEIGGVMG